MRIHPPTPRSRRRAAVAAGLLMGLLLLPSTALAHAELEDSTPAEGAQVDGPFADPIVLTFSEALVGESGAELRDSAGTVPATDDVEGDTITLTPEDALAEGDYEIEWTAIADDGHVERGTIRFTVVVPATPEPTATPSPTPTATPAASPSATASTVPTASPTPSAASTPAASPAGPDDSSGTGGAGDVLLPIVLGALLIGGLAILLFRRRDSSSTMP